ncbi:MAG: lysoplasmalogenase family protein [Anaerolineae bacterium]
MCSELLTWPRAAWLGVLLATWAILLFSGLGAEPQPGRLGRMPRGRRILSSLVLVIAGWSWAWFSRDAAGAGYAALIALGMTLGFVGDLFMANLVPGPQPVLGGMAAFGLGHVAYIAAGLRAGTAYNFDAAGARSIAWAVWLLIGVAGWYVAVMRGQERTALQWIALPYALLLASTAGVATGLALQAAAFAPLAAGAALFLVSDLILAAGLFSGWRHPRRDDIVWLFYGPGQMLIVYSIGTVGKNILG